MGLFAGEVVKKVDAKFKGDKMPRFKCPRCGRRRVVMAGKNKQCYHCVDVELVPDPKFSGQAGVPEASGKSKRQKPKVQR